MGFSDSLKNFYVNIENGFYGLMDSVEKAGIPVYKVIDPLESSGIPAFPVFVILFLLLIGGMFLFFTGGFAQPLSVKVMVLDSSGLPLSNASVEIESVSTQYTNENGIAEFINFPSDKLDRELAVNAIKSGYVSSQGISKTFTKDLLELTITLREAQTELTKTINLVMENGEIFSDSIRLEIECSDVSFNEEVTAINGSARITIPSGCGTLSINPQTDEFTADETAFDAGDASIVISFSPKEAGSGTAIASITDEEGNPVSGIMVYLKEKNNPSSPVDSGYTSDAGTIEFENIAGGKYFISTYDPSGTFSEYSGMERGEFKEIAGYSSARFYAVLEKNVVGSIKIIATDSASREGIENAEVTLFKDGEKSSEERTDEEGIAEFFVGENVEFSASVDKTGYLIESITGLYPRESAYELLLERETASNANALKVKVVDDSIKKEPVDGAKIMLFNEDSTPVALDATTGKNGIVFIEKMPEGTYYIKAAKPGFGETELEYITVKARQENSIELVMPIGSGNVELTVLNNEKQEFAGAKTDAYDYYSGEKIESLSGKLTDAKGKTNFSIRADKKVYFRVSAKDFASIITVPMQVEKDVTLNKTISLDSASNQLSLEFQGIYSEGALIGDAIEQGQSYTVKFKLKLPKGSRFKEAGFHLRAGSDNSKEMEKDGIYFSSINSAAQITRKGTTFNPPKGYGIDVQHLASGDAKWAEGIISSPEAEIYEIEAVLQAKDSATANSLQELHYRAWGKTGSYQRYPSDSELGSSESSANRQALYAQTKVHSFSIGESNYCYENFCIQLAVTDDSRKIKSNALDSFSAKISNDYTLEFRISSISEQGFNESEFIASNEAGALELGNYSVTKISGSIEAGTAEKNSVRIELGQFQKDDQINGTIKFRAEKEGITPFELSILSEGEKVFMKELMVETETAKEMNMEILPKVIVPFIKNNVLVRITDSNQTNPLQAEVHVIVNKAVYSHGFTDKQGIYAFELNDPQPGMKIKIIAKKPGYKAVEKEITVTENILTLTPEKIAETLSLGTNEAMNVEVKIENHTLIPLKIQSAEFAVDEGLVKTASEAGFIGSEIPVEGSIAPKFFFSLGNEAQAITQPATVSGNILLRITQADSNTWLTVIPFEIRIAFPGSVEEASCLNITPPKWDFSTGKELQETALSISNNCKAEGNPVKLFNLSARIKTTSQDKIGTYAVKLNDKLFELNESWAIISNSIEKESTASGVLSFKPEEIAGGEGDYVIEFKAVNKTISGDEEIKAEMTSKATVNILQECVEVIGKDEVIIESCPYNTGYGNFGNYFGSTAVGTGAYSGLGFDPNYALYNQGNAGGGPQPWYINSGSQNNYSGYQNSSYPGSQNYYYRQPAYPSAQYNYPYYNSDYSMQQGTSTAWNCGTAAVVIRNNCTKDIVIDATDGTQVLIQESPMTIEAGSEKQLVMQAAYLVGKFPVELKAKLADSKEKSKKIKELQVLIESENMKNYYDCISVNPSGTLQFSEFLPKAKTISIRNSCYNSGIRLMPRADTITFTTSGLLNPMDRTTTAGEPNPRIGSEGIEDNSVISSWNFKGPITYETDAQGNVVEVLKFDVIKNFSYYGRQAPTLLRDEKTPKDLGNIRYFITGTYYAINARTDLIVKFRSAKTGTQQEVTFPFNITDYWRILDFTSNAISYGDNTTRPKDCIDSKQLDFGKDCKSGDEIAQGIKTKRLFKTGKSDLDRFNAKVVETGCGSVDKITETSPESFTQNGVKFEIKISDNGHELEISADTKNWHGTRIDVSEQIEITVTRAGMGKSDTVKATLKFCIESEEETPEVQGATETCNGGETGEDAYNNYGFNKISFEWAADKITKNSCDAYNYTDGTTELTSTYYCDGMQFGLSLSEKIKKLSEYMNPPNGTKPTQLIIDAKLNTEATHPNKYITALLKTIEIENKKGTGTNATTEKLKFWLSDSGSGIQTNALPIAASTETNQIINANLTNTTAQNTTIESFANINNSLATNNKNVLILINPAKKMEGTSWKEAIMAAADKTTLTANFYADEKEITVGNAKNAYLILTLDEFIEAQTQCIGTAPNEICTVNSKQIPAAFLRDNIYNRIAYVIYGKRADIKTDSEEDLKTLMKGAANTQLLVPLPAGYNNFLEFYNDVLAPKVLLKKEIYGNTLILKFNEIYGTGTNKKELKFNNSVISFKKAAAKDKIPVDAGMQEILNKITGTNLEDTKLVTEFASFKPLSENNPEYAKNPFFYLSFDGAKGVSDAYGLVYSGASKKVYLRELQKDEKTPFRENTYELKTAASSTASNKFNIDFVSDFTKIQDGKIMSVSKTGMDYSPSDPIELKADITFTNKSQSGMLYEFGTESRGIDMPIQFREWISGSNYEPNVTEAPESDLCAEEKGTKEYDAVLLSDSSETLEGTIFLPADDGKNYLFLLVTANSRATVKTKDVTAGKEDSTESVSCKTQSSYAQMRSGELKDRIKGEYTLQQLIERIKETQDKGAVCVKPNKSEMEFYWNFITKEKIETGTQPAEKEKPKEETPSREYDYN